jgi:hypothetical protein
MGVSPMHFSGMGEMPMLRKRIHATIVSMARGIEKGGMPRFSCVWKRGLLHFAGRKLRFKSPVRMSVTTIERLSATVKASRKGRYPQPFRPVLSPNRSIRRRAHQRESERRNFP